jgi:RNA polymerase sigma factor (sigma-70 family)
MADFSTPSLLAQLLRGDDRSDHALLTAYAQDRDQAAFEALVCRYAKLVFGVCRRALANQQDAEDAFQASFVVLSRKAGTLNPARPLASWLYGVAVKVSQEARRKSLRRERREQKATLMSPTELRPAVDPDDRWADVEAELAGLPGQHRDPLVLCFLQRMTHQEAAEALQIPLGSMARRVEQGLTALRERLKRRGLALSAAALTAALTEAGRGAAAPPALLAAAARAGTGAELPAPVLELAKAGMPTAATHAHVWTALAVCTGLAGLGAWAAVRAPQQEPPIKEHPAIAQRDAGEPAAGLVPAAGPRIARFELRVWRPDPDAKRLVSLDRVRERGTTPLYKADRFVWEVDVADAPGPCLLLRVLPDGSEVPCWPPDATAKPDAQKSLRYPAVNADVPDFGFDEAGNQLFVAVLQETPEPYADWAARKGQVPWRTVKGDGLWFYDSAAGVKPMNVFNGQLRAENPETRGPVEEAGRHYAQAPNVRAVRLYGMSIRGQ